MAIWGTASDLPDTFPLGFMEPMPTVYIVVADGTIRWHDKRARYGHCDPGDFERDLENGIAQVLESPSGLETSKNR